MPFGQRIDHDGLVGARHLGDAEERVIGGFAQELGVDGDEGVRARRAQAAARSAVVVIKSMTVS